MPHGARRLAIVRTRRLDQECKLKNRIPDGRRKDERRASPEMAGRRTLFRAALPPLPGRLRCSPVRLTHAARANRPDPHPALASSPTAAARSRGSSRRRKRARELTGSDPCRSPRGSDVRSCAQPSSSRKRPRPGAARCSAGPASACRHRLHGAVPNARVDFGHTLAIRDTLEYRCADRAALRRGQQQTRWRLRACRQPTSRATPRHALLSAPCRRCGPRSSGSPNAACPRPPCCC